MILGTGIDLVEVARFERENSRPERGGFDDVLTPDELRQCRQLRRPVVGYAVGFAAKEACFKAIGTGKIGAMSWLDIEISRFGREFSVKLTGETAAAAGRADIEKIHMSVAVAAGHAMAWAVAMGNR